MTSDELRALEHIDRSGNLLGIPGSADGLFEKLERKGLIERNKWSGIWMPTESGKHELSR